jgi:hypothetical protein
LDGKREDEEFVRVEGESDTRHQADEPLDRR